MQTFQFCIKAESLENPWNCKFSLKVQNMTFSVFLFLTFVLFNALAQGTPHCHNSTGRCYWMGTGQKSWSDARSACQSEGGDLAVIETLELWDFTVSVFGIM